MAEANCADAFAIDPDTPWTAQLASGLRQFRSLLVAHPHAAPLLRERPPTTGFATVDRVLPVLAEMPDEERFDLGVDLLVAGLGNLLATRDRQERPLAPARSQE